MAGMKTFINALLVILWALVLIVAAAYAPLYFVLFYGVLGLMAVGGIMAVVHWITGRPR